MFITLRFLFVSIRHHQSHERHGQSLERVEHEHAELALLRVADLALAEFPRALTALESSYSLYPIYVFVSVSPFQSSANNAANAAQQYNGELSQLSRIVKSHDVQHWESSQ